MRTDPQERERALRLIAADQGGYFTASQARGVGYGYRLQHFHRSRGNWLAVERGIFRYPDFPGSPHEDLIRWALWSRSRRGDIQAVVSHDTALAVHELGDAMPAAIHLTVPPSFRKRAPGGCVLHRASLAANEVEQREGFLVTTPLRTLVDVADSAFSPDQLAAAVKDAVDRGLVGRVELVDERLPHRARARLIEALRLTLEVLP